MKNRFTIIISLLMIGLITLPAATVRGWGPHGHEISGRAAAMRLPQRMPAFFRRSVDQLSYLNPEPDRWRERVESNLDRAMDSAAAPEHYLDMELVPEAAARAVNRYDFTAELIKAGQKPTTAGFVQYRILELFQRLRVEFRLWRAEKEPNKRRWIEQRIINDAGILGHYVSDTANPHHTTIHFNGWSGANPKGYTVYARERGIHFRFEEEYVGAQIRLKDILPLVTMNPRVFENPRQAIWDHLKKTHALVEELYILDKKEQFSATNTSPEHKSFVTARLAAGAGMLRDLWWTAWVTSELPPAAPQR
ncbi:MAG: hypothetical protein IPM66_17505 [Acidobacteriota bacterium]|nr:MAG: hypothetical protein IPM66_17505 [Acidobacteriota bacterium]